MINLFESNTLPDLFEENFKEIKKWEDFTSSGNFKILRKLNYGGIIFFSMQGEEASALASTEGANMLDRTNDKSVPESNTLPDLFEENFKEIKKWVDVKSSKYATLLVIRERRCGRLGTALKALNDMIQVDGEAPKKKLYELKLSLLDQIGWGHLVSYERQWMHVRFPASLLLF